MASCREILTLQLGPYANYVGSHLWNIQESGFNYIKDKELEICHDVLFREGRTFEGGVTFTPRTLCVEYSSKLPPVPTLDDPVTKPSILWDESHIDKVECDETNTLHPFIEDLEAGLDVSSKDYKFENSARGWGDILRTRLHARSVVTGYSPKDEDVENRIRSFVEECDNLQGFHIIYDTSETFSELFLTLDDEYSSKMRTIFPVIEPVKHVNFQESASRCLRTFLSLYESTHSSLVVPLSCTSEISLKEDAPQSFPHLLYDLQTRHHTSAIIASFLDTFSLNYRTSNDFADMHDTYSAFTANNWRFATSSLALPFALKPGKTIMENLEERDEQEPLWSSLSPFGGSEKALYQTFGIRGVKDPNTVLQYIQFLSSTVTSVKGIQAPMPSLTPFPKIFSPHVSTIGSVDPTASRMEGFDVKSTPVFAGVHSCPEIAIKLESLTDMAVKIEKRRLSNLSIENDLFLEIIESMRHYGALYTPNNFD